MGYIQLTIIVIAAFAVGATATKCLIPMLHRMHTGQNIREDGPQSHLSKAGTPSMGGLAIIFTTVIITAISLVSLKFFNNEFWVLIFGFAVFGALGFWDDFIKIIKKHNLGLRAWQKLAAQIIIGFVIAWYMSNHAASGTSVFIPFAKINVDFGIWYVPFVAFTIIAMTNAVNLTDGLDGLAGGVTAIVSLFFALAAYNFGSDTEAVFFAALAGSCAGFLVYNRHPAKLFMGDTGSLALGGGLATAAILSNLTLLLPIAGIIYVVEALSVMLQVGSYKLRHGKRIFRMAPLHHHFELGGMKETKVVAMFWTVSLVFCILGFFGI